MPEKPKGEGEPKLMIRRLDKDELTELAREVALGDVDVRSALVAVIYSMACSAEAENA